MTCDRCGAEFTDQLVDICVCETKPGRVITDVPALVCPRCDNRIFSGDVAVQIDDIRDRFADPADYDEIRPLLVYRFGAARGQTTLPFSQDERERMAGLSTLSSARRLPETTRVAVTAYDESTAQSA